MRYTRVRALALLAIAGCGDDPRVPGMSEVEEADAAVYEGCPDSIPVFEIGMQSSGAEGRIRASLIDAVPAPSLAESGWNMRRSAWFT